jgi:hypothetical protein
VVADERGQLTSAAETPRLRVGELPGELRDEGRDVAELPFATEALERRHLVVAEPFLDDGERELPRGLTHLCGETLE